VRSEKWKKPGVWSGEEEWLLVFFSGSLPSALPASAELRAKSGEKRNRKGAKVAEGRGGEKRGAWRPERGERVAALFLI
jgi:hypothetical protein